MKHILAAVLISLFGSACAENFGPPVSVGDGVGSDIITAGPEITPTVEIIARGHSGVDVTTTASVNGTLVTGTIVISNPGSTTATVTAISDWLEVRYPSGAHVPGYPTGTTTDAYRVGDIAAALPAPIPPNGSVTITYSADLCDDAIASYAGAKDMRNATVVTADGSTTVARTATFVPLNQSWCPVCGNGRVEAGEQCDGGTCCTATCEIRDDGSACNDGNVCTQIDTCSAGVCVGAQPVECTPLDQCHLAGTCDPSTGACSNPIRANGASCDDGDACTLGDVCSAGWCTGAPMQCDDGNPCTDDTCAAGACVATNNTASCDDGSACTVGEQCAGGACVGGAPRDCNDHQSCTSDACTEPAGCSHVATASCDVCYADECTTCQTACTADRQACEASCWSAFAVCLNGCTTTYCAPFCQVDYGACVQACPSEQACDDDCQLGNGCGPGCAPS